MPENRHLKNLKSSNRLRYSGAAGSPTKEIDMKNLIALLALAAASGMALAQAGSAPTTNSQGSQAPPAQTQPAQGAQGAQAAPPAGPAGKRAPQAKSQEEYKAFQEAVAKPDPAAQEQAANAFATQYPQSELRAPLYQQVMLQYQNANNADKTVEIGRKALGL